MLTSPRYLSCLLSSALVLALLALPARADNWQMYATVDNEFDVYFGTNLTTNFYAGGGNNWGAEYSFTALGRAPTDYLYVATSSDQSGAQGFIGTFTNTTTSATISTGNVVWEVFNAGAFQATNPYWPSAWPVSQMPTQTQVDTAISFATVNSLWTTPSQNAGYDNDPSTPIAPYTFIWPTSLPNVQQSAKWIWYDTGLDPGSAQLPAPLNGFNHDEFLVFRVAGIAPEPATAALLALGGMFVLKRRRNQPM